MAGHARPANYVTKPCAKCGEDFTIHRSQEGRGQGRYCSRVCARSGSPCRKRQRPTVTCGYCSTTFDKVAAEVRKNRSGHHFCSPSCWYDFNQRENHYEWAGGQQGRVSREGRAWRRAVLARDCGFCRICHAAEQLEAHHIRPYSTHPEQRWLVENGVTLCEDCHRKFRGVELEYVEILSFVASVPVVVWQVPDDDETAARTRRPASAT